MPEPIIIRDNSKERRPELTEKQWSDLAMFSGCKVKDLCDRDDDVSLLVFPDSLDVYGDQIGDSVILDIQNDTISSGNLMGFVGCRGTNLRIRSRFDKGEEDFLMHYLLERVFSVNLFDLPHTTDADSVFDFILFLFPFFLKRAMTQGLYKEYVNRQYNDDKVRGALDLSRHIRLNIPFTGKVAYRTRELTADNALMELIRHTIEYIRTKGFGSSILTRDEETKSNVALVVDATPTYERKARERVVNMNLRAKIHPYYSEYEPLRKLCLQILRQEEIKYGQDDDTVYGVLFDGAWLWEEYLGLLLETLDFKHPKNKEGTGRIYLFNPNAGLRFPDFYNSEMVLDAKYKRYAEKDQGISGVSREDIAQVISYMYVLKLGIGGFLVPGGESVTVRRKTLNGYGGEMLLINLPVAHSVASYSDYCDIMAQQEGLLKEVVTSWSRTE